MAARRGCLNCHTLDGQPHIGPSWAGLYRSPVRLDGGRTVVADDAYLTRSMMDPQADVVAGFQGVMPTYRGVLPEPEVAALVELIHSLQDAALRAEHHAPESDPAGLRASRRNRDHDDDRRGPRPRPPASSPRGARPTSTSRTR